MQFGRVPRLCAQGLCLRPRFASNSLRQSPSFIHQHLAEPVEHIWSRAKLAGRIGLTLLGVGLAAAGTAYGVLHIWAANELGAEPVDAEARTWQWDVLQTDNWSGEHDFGVLGNHVYRLAYLSQRWAAKDEFLVVEDPEDPDRRLRTLPTDLLQLQRLLGSVISIAEKQANRQTLPQLLLKRATVLERIGGPDFLAQARDLYEMAWKSLNGQGLLATHIAWKLEELSNRLGRDEAESLSWWSQALQMCDDSSSDPLDPVPKRLPASPFTQRVLAATLVSLSSFYATHDKFDDAVKLESASVPLLLSATNAETTHSPYEKLHTATILQKAAVLAVHQAEVLYQMKSDTRTALEKLTWAALSSEHCATSLTTNGQLSPEYSKDFIHQPATVLLQSSCRTAAIAWNLVGILRQQARRPDRAAVLESYQKALRWAQINGEPAEYILQSEWEKMVERYGKARAAMERT